MTQEQISDWMYDQVRMVGFSNATSLAESFLQSHRICDPLDPVFSVALDAAFRIAQEIRDHDMCAVVA